MMGNGVWDDEDNVMADGAHIDILELIDAILGERQLREGATFTTHAYADQPILETGRQLQERRAAERAAAPAAERDDGQDAGLGRGRREALREEQRREARMARRVRRRGAVRDRSSSQAAGHFSGGYAGAPAWLRELDASARPPRSSGSVPKRYREMRALANEAGDHWAMSSPQLFFEQACLMADNEDDYPHAVPFSYYYPNYAVMDVAQLRTYFTWRTRVRAGTVERTSVSYAFVYVFELLCGIGTEAGRQGYADLVSFWQAFSPHAFGTSFDSLMRRWTHDYAIYHDIVDVLLPTTGEGAGTGGDGRGASGLAAAGVPTTGLSHGDAIMCLVDAEAAALRQAGRTRKLASSDEGATAPNDGKLLDALATVSRYHIERSRFAKDHRDDLAAIVSSVFASLVIHCSRRRKTDFVEGLFGSSADEPYAMYPSAVFYDPSPPADGTVVVVGRAESYRCVRGYWTRSVAYRRDEPSRELGVILRAVDSRARERFAYGHPIKVLKAPPAYVQRIIDKAVDERVSWRREADARRISIDLSKLGDIRATAMSTREALLVDEERENADELPDTNIHVDTPSLSSTDTNKSASFFKNTLAISGTHDTIQTDVVNKEKGGDNDDLFDSTERAVIEALLLGNAQDALRAATEGGAMASMVIDGINEKLFDAIGDAAIEFVGDVPTLVGDYEQDVREVVDHG